MYRIVILDKGGKELESLGCTSQTLLHSVYQIVMGVGATHSFSGRAVLRLVFVLQLILEFWEHI